MTLCKMCGLETGKFNVQIDDKSSGVCNYCRYWLENRTRLTDYENLQWVLDQRIEKLRGRGSYDALVGFSGGKDSTYVVDTLVEKYGLRVKAITFDNGFVTDYAQKNIARIVEQLGIDHCFHSPDRALQRAFYGAALKTYGDPCVACAIPIYYYSIKYAYQNDIPFVVHGRTPFQIFRNFYRNSPDIFIDLHLSNYMPHSFDELARIYKAMDEAARKWLFEMFPDDRKLRNEIYEEFFLDVETVSKTRLPDFIGLFQYRRYNEEAIKRQMEKETSYQRPKEDELLGHGDCAIHDACANIFYRIHGASATKIEIAAMVRHGEISPEQANHLLISKANREASVPISSMESLCTFVGLDTTEVDGVVETLKNHLVDKFCCH